MDAVEQWVGTTKRPAGADGGTDRLAFHKQDVRGTGMGRHFDVPKAVEREAWLPGFFPIAFENIGISLASDVRGMGVGTPIERVICVDTAPVPQ